MTDEDKQLVDYIEKLESTFATEGWKSLVKDLESDLDSKREEMTYGLTSEGYYKRVGIIETLRKVINFPLFIENLRKAFEEKQNTALNDLP